MVVCQRPVVAASVAFDALVDSNGREVCVVDEALKRYPDVLPQSIALGVQQLLEANVLARPAFVSGLCVLFERRSLLHGWRIVQAEGDSAIDSTIKLSVSTLIDQKKIAEVTRKQLTAQELEVDLKLQELELRRRKILKETSEFEAHAK